MEYYSVLGVSTHASDEEVRRAYRKLAMQWHPDKWAKTPSLVGDAKRKFQKIQEAYSVLSDRSKRMLYDAGLYRCDDEVEGFADFLQEMVSLMNDAREEQKNCSIEELQSMFWEMTQDFGIPEWNNYVQIPAWESQWYSSYNSGTARSSSRGATMIQGDLHSFKSSFEGFCADQFADFVNIAFKEPSELRR